MNIKSKKLLLILMLFIMQPIAMANPSFYPYIKNYSNCSVTVLEDSSIAVSFRAHLVNDLFSDVNPHIEQWKQLIKIPDDESIKLIPHHAILSLYFYNYNGEENHSINIRNISNIFLDGANSSHASNNIKEIKFDSSPGTFSHTHYDVSFTIAANTLKNVRIGATVGGVLNRGEQQYSLLSSKGLSFGSTGKQCEIFDPQAGVAPEAVKIDPKFRLSSARWQLKPLDLDLLLDNTANGAGLDASLENAENNRFCIHYQSMGVRPVLHRIQANNLNGLSADRNHFQLKDKDKIINYQVILITEGINYAFFLPEDNYINYLKKDAEKMCWTPKIKLFSTNTTDKGSYSDTLNFTITPLA
ncbi:alpha-related fimbriae major subunit [Yersinia enterocolitica]|uniref:hypothetical protein n=1 Tax=Yersinia enterocolitica TaxID=630 RepID=UPI0005EA31FB|nr:hypothetical protein [Yersinia enterocolitica]CNG02308.1 alpha-related fimbriae major subunit [Yersinia enterocolitica]CRY15469.1 alpha-related fimbriae major subunit [Yersinia enterocolitica]